MRDVGERDEPVDPRRVGGEQAARARRDGDRVAVFSLLPAGGSTTSVSGGGPDRARSAASRRVPPSSELCTSPVRSVLSALSRVTVGPAPGTARPIAPLPLERERARRPRPRPQRTGDHHERGEDRCGAARTVGVLPSGRASRGFEAGRLRGRRRRGGGSAELRSSSTESKAVPPDVACGQVIVERSMDERWLSNAFVVGDEPGGIASSSTAARRSSRCSRRSSASG